MYITLNYGVSAYSNTGYGKMRIRQAEQERRRQQEKRKPYDRGFTNQYDFKKELEAALASF